MNRSQLIEGKVQVFVLCGTAGSGKTSLGKECAKYFNCEFIEGDDLHPIENKEMMKRGQPLEDQHRFPWLKKISETIKLKSSENQIKLNSNKLFVACSALKRIYRDEILNNLTNRENVCWVFLKIDDKEKLKERIEARKGHFMNPNLIQSQFDILEPPNCENENVIELPIETESISTIVDKLINIISKLNDQ